MVSETPAAVAVAGKYVVTCVAETKAAMVAPVPRVPPEIELVEIPSANHTFGTITIPRAATMARITAAAGERIDRRLTP